MEEESRSKRAAAAQEQADRTAFDAYVKQLGKAERASLEAKALAAADAETRAGYADPAMAKYRETFLLKILREHLRPLLREQATADT